jgi:hypothetical protein
MTLPAGWTDLVARHPRRIPSGSACHKDASITARGAQMRELRPACPGLRGDEVAGTGSSSRTRPATRLHEELLIKASAAGACILRQRTRSPTAGSPQARWPGAVSRRGRPSSIRDGRDRGFGASARPWRFPMTPITHMRAAKRVKLGLVTRTERGLFVVKSLVGLLLRRRVWPVLAGVKVGPACAPRCGPGRRGCAIRVASTALTAKIKGFVGGQGGS